MSFFIPNFLMVKMVLNKLRVIKNVKKNTKENNKEKERKKT